VRYSLRQIACPQCCTAFECELQCDCSSGPGCDTNPGAPVAGTSPDGTSPNPVKRGGGQCLCNYLTNLDPNPNCDDLHEIGKQSARLRVNLRHGVPLACVRLRRDQSDWVFDTWIEACGPRRLIKRNDVLFDLIRGC